MKTLILLLILLVPFAAHARDNWPMGSEIGEIDDNQHVCPSLEVWKQIQRFDDGYESFFHQCVYSSTNDHVKILDTEYLHQYGALHIRLTQSQGLGVPPKVTVGYVRIGAFNRLTGGGFPKQMADIHELGPDPNRIDEHAGMNPDGTARVVHIPPPPESDWTASNFFNTVLVPKHN